VIVSGSIRRRSYVRRFSAIRVAVVAGHLPALARLFARFG
jgi:hypothetical protein